MAQPGWSGFRLLGLIGFVFASHVTVFSETATLPVSTGGIPQLVVEIDTLSTAQKLPHGVLRLGANHSLQTIYKTVNIEIDRIDDQNIPDLKPGHRYTAGELHNLHASYANRKQANGSWHVHALVLTSFIDQGTYGYMFDERSRQAFAVFTTALGNDPAKILRTTAHELGHTLNLFDSDGDGNMLCCQGTDATQKTGRSIMNATRCLANDWTYQFSLNEREHLLRHPKDRVEPGTTFGFDQCIASHKRVC